MTPHHIENHTTVKQMIEALRQLPPDAWLFVGGRDACLPEPGKVARIAVHFMGPNEVLGKYDDDYDDIVIEGYLL